MAIGRSQCTRRISRRLPSPQVTACMNLEWWDLDSVIHFRLIKFTLHQLMGTVCLVDLDDNFFYERHLLIIWQNSRLYTRFQKANLNLTPNKCSLFVRQVEYLGQNILTDGVSTDRRKFSALTNWPIPIPRQWSTNHHWVGIILPKIRPKFHPNLQPFIFPGTKKS